MPCFAWLTLCPTCMQAPVWKPEKYTPEQEASWAAQGAHCWACHVPCGLGPAGAGMLHGYQHGLQVTAYCPWPAHHQQMLCPCLCAGEEGCSLAGRARCRGAGQ
jgi:hypothetical protein